jgi:hypothetical protein
MKPSEVFVARADIAEWPLRSPFNPVYLDAMENDETSPMDCDDPDRSASRRLIATAWHEAGHAVMALALGRPVQKVTIAPAQQPAGGAQLGACKIQKGRFKPSDDWLEDEVLILLAGMVAEARFTDEYCQFGAAQDLRHVRRLLQNRANNDRQLERLERRLLDKTEHLLSDDANARALQLIAAELEQKTTISGRTARHLYQQAVQQTT